MPHEADIAAAVDAAIAARRVRYSADAESDPHAAVAEPLGFEYHVRDRDGKVVDTFKPETPRGVVADRLEDDGRATEAAKLRAKGMVAQDTRPGHLGKIRRGVYSHEPIEHKIGHVENALYDWFSGGHRNPVFEFNPDDDEAAQHAEQYEPREPHEVHVRTSDGDYDGGRDPYGDTQDDYVHYDNLADHVADEIDSRVGRSSRNAWQDEDYYRVYGGDLPATDALGELMGWDLSREGYDRLERGRGSHGIRAIHSFYRRGGEGYSGDAEEAARYLSNLHDDLAADLAERHGENREETLNYPDLNKAKLTEAARLAKEAEKEFDALAREPEARDDFHRGEYEAALQKLRQTRPIVADPSDTDE